MTSLVAPGPCNPHQPSPTPPPVRNTSFNHHSPMHSESSRSPPPSARLASNTNLANPHIYMAVYSNVPVYEMMARGISVMRRRADSYMNATQILKVAGVDKARRTRILDKDVLQGTHEKIQGGYGRYQGTWVPFPRAIELAREFGVSAILAPLFDYTGVAPSHSPSPFVEAAPTAAQPPPPPPPSHLTEQQPNQDHSNHHPIGGWTNGANQTSHLDTQATGSKRRRTTEDERDGLLSVAVGGTGPKRTRLDHGEIEEDENDGGIFANKEAPVIGTRLETVPTHLKIRPSSKLSRDHSIGDDLLRTELHRGMILRLFAPSSGKDANGALPAGVDLPDSSLNFLPSDVDPDTPIDEQLHTALHWASALARLPLVTSLVTMGADISRGNAAGETPLMRAVLAVNCYESDCFPVLLQSLGPSIRNADNSGRTVLHHIALIAGVKGRAVSARNYLEGILEFVAKNENGEFKELVDYQDVNGDTALNIAARVGNRSLVRLLLEVGASKMRANKLGLRPGDFGLEEEDLKVESTEDIVAALRSRPSTSVPLQKSREVITTITGMIDGLGTDFAAEIKAKSEALDRIRIHLKSATRELAEQRKQVHAWRQQCAELDDVEQRIQNLERALREEQIFDWTGRTEVDGSPSKVGPGFAYHGPASTLSNLPSLAAMTLDTDPMERRASDGDDETLVYLYRQEAWYQRALSLLSQRLEKVRGTDSKREHDFREVISRSCGVEKSDVDALVESGLLAAMDGTVELSRIEGFLQKLSSS